MKWKAFQNRPLLHFAVLGSLLFGASEQLAPQTRPDGEPQRIRLEAATIARMVDQFERRSREKASPSVRRALIRAWVDEELLFREALQLGLDRGDSSVARRLLEKYRPLAEDPQRPDVELIAEARALGWVEHDIVVRRILVERVRRLLRYDPEGVVSQEEIDAAIASRVDVHQTPATRDFEHLFLGEVAAPGTTDMALPTTDWEIPDRGRTLQDLESRSQPFPLGLSFRAQDELRIASRFGKAFAQQVFAAPSGTWFGPVASSHGWHIVRVTGARAAAPLPTDVTRTRAIRTVSRQHGEARLRRQLERLSKRYLIEVDDPDWHNERTAIWRARNT